MGVTVDVPEQCAGMVRMTYHGVKHHYSNCRLMVERYGCMLIFDGAMMDTVSPVHSHRSGMSTHLRDNL